MGDNYINANILAVTVPMITQNIKLVYNTNSSIAFKICIHVLSQIPFFDDPVAQCMQSLDSLETKDLSQKCEYFNLLSRTIPQIPSVSQPELSHLFCLYVKCHEIY